MCRAIAAPRASLPTRELPCFCSVTNQEATPVTVMIFAPPPSDPIPENIARRLTPPRLMALARMAARRDDPSLDYAGEALDPAVFTRRGFPAELMAQRMGLPIDKCAAYLDAYHRHQP